MIQYIYDVIPDKSQLLTLYDDAKWSNYTKDVNQLHQAINNSLCVISAYDNLQLVGLIRIVGDGISIIYIQDILVRSDYKRKNIGSELLRLIINKYNNVRLKVLLTDDCTETRGFYEKNGFVSCDKGKLVSFVKIN